MEKQLRFYTEGESEIWLSERGRTKPELVPDVRTERIEYPNKAYGYCFIANWVAANLAYRRPVLLLITEWGVWGSSENWHLYYKLRHSYGDHRLLHEAPGHLFLEYETEDLASFLQIAMLNGWGGYVLTEANYTNAFFSHDEYFDFFDDNQANLANIRRELGPSQPNTDGTTRNNS